MKYKRLFLTTFFVLIPVLSVYRAWIFIQDSNEGEPWTFAVICDTRSDEYDKTGINGVVIKAMADAIVKDGCDLVLVPGDMINGYSKENNISTEKQFENWKTAMSSVYNAGIKVYTVRGNHETGRSGDIYIQAFAPDNPDNGPQDEKDLTYSFTHNNAFFIGIDEYAGNHTHKVNQEWVDSQLKNNSEEHIFVFGHEPAFKVGHEGCLEVYPEERDEFWNSIGNAGCQVYFCGHDHFYNRACIQDDSGNKVYQIIDGSGGAPFARWDTSKGKENSRFKLEYHNQVDYGYMLVTVDGDNVNLEWKAWDGSGDPIWVTKDSFRLEKE